MQSYQSHLLSNNNQEQFPILFFNHIFLQLFRPFTVPIIQGKLDNWSINLLSCIKFPYVAMIKIEKFIILHKIIRRQIRDEVLFDIFLISQPISIRSVEINRSIQIGEVVSGRNRNVSDFPWLNENVKLLRFGMGLVLRMINLDLMCTINSSSQKTGSSYCEGGNLTLFRNDCLRQKGIVRLCHDSPTEHSETSAF